ncbi:hypothetical protein [Mesoterricola sediminis]|uniref:Uncharacterized protein n=1 Tax=Mesoterricola sediminis TaxID=2927980 RepID=A0AA48KC88_9BACT|nr:hypothetical protein [Mesoterricola sediminis]BDU75097.1 hypothetical protein METESE_00550 [Mesoterricola sediminis]
MAFFSRFFASADKTPLPTLEELMAERQIPLDLPGLEPFKVEFQHLRAAERVRWADALAESVAHGWPLPPDWVDAQFDLRPEVVPLWMAERDGRYYRPFIEGLAVRILACGQVIPEPWLTLWGLGAPDLMDRAMDQLREASKDKPFQRLPTGIYQGVFDDGQAASRLLAPELWEGLFPGQNTFVAVPSEDRILIAPQVLLPKLVEAITTSLGGPGRRIAATIYQRVHEHLLPANLQDPHPMAQPQRELRQSDLAEAYRAQEAALPAELGHPAPLGMLRTQQGRSVSLTTWQEGDAVLLPESDLVGFLAATGQPLGIYFRQTLPRISELHGTPVDIWGPRRLRYEGFPTAAQLERLECFATPEQMAALIKGAAQPAAHRPTPAALASQAQQGALSAQASSPVPAHLRGLSLGVQSDD